MNKKLLVTTTTFPRWNEDGTPRFIKDLTDSYSSKYKIKLLAPHFLNSLVFEESDSYSVKRYRYFYPYKHENIVYEGGGSAKVNKNFPYLLKLSFLLLSQFLNVLYYRLSGYKSVHAHWIIPQGFVAVLVKKLLKTKVIISVHGSDISTLNTGLFKKIKRFALKNADFVTVNSNDTENLCSKIYDRDYIVIPMGIDTEHFKKRPIIPKNKTIKLVFVGRFTAEKGIDNLIKIIDGLREYKINFTLEIIGDGEKKNNLETFIKKRDLYEKVILPGWLPREKLIQSLYSADIFMSTSKREAQGVAIIEALSCGVPVISTDVGGVSDVLIDGFNGYLVENNNMDDFIKKIKSLNDNRELLKKLSKNASYNIHKKYSWTSIGANFEKLLN